MQRTSLISRFLAGFSPQPSPPRGPNGMVGAPPPASLPVIQTPSLCEAGPCSHYHCVVSVMDTQEPIGGEGDTHLQTTRACYPSPGIELELGETPVMHCSRWEPDLSEDARVSELRRKFLGSVQGKKFTADVATFERELAAADDAQDPYLPQQPPVVAPPIPNDMTLLDNIDEQLELP